MHASPETLLATLPGSNDCERLLVVLCHTPSGSSQVQLRQQSWAEGLGWFTQSSVELEPSQVAGLRQALGLGGSFSKVKTAAFPETAPRRFGGFTPRVVHADSA